jgi:hypothetical protein
LIDLKSYFSPSCNGPSTHAGAIVPRVEEEHVQEENCEDAQVQEEATR